jgi:hypothetical protein
MCLPERALDAIGDPHTGSGDLTSGGIRSFIIETGPRTRQGVPRPGLPWGGICLFSLIQGEGKNPYAEDPPKSALRASEVIPGTFITRREDAWHRAG